MLRAKDIGNLVESEVEEYGQMGKGGRLIQIREHTEPCGAKIMMDVEAWTCFCAQGRA